MKRRSKFLDEAGVPDFLPEIYDVSIGGVPFRAVKYNRTLSSLHQSADPPTRFLVSPAWSIVPSS